MMQRLTYFIVLVSAISTIYSCKSTEAPDCFKSAGKEVTESRSFNGVLKEVFIDDLIDIEIRTDQTNGIEVIGPVYLLDGLITDQDGSSLTIRNENTCNWVRRMGLRFKVVLHASELAQMHYTGQGDVIFVDTLRSDHLFFENKQGFGDVFIRYAGDSIHVSNHTGYANITVQGEARVANLFHQGVGVFDASDLQSGTVLSNNRSINALKLWSTGYLFATIGNKGNTYYRGNPFQIDTEQLGSGSLIHLPY